MVVNANASVESQMRGSSCGINGKVIGLEPAAMIALSKVILVIPFDEVTSMV